MDTGFLNLWVIGNEDIPASGMGNEGYTETFEIPYQPHRQHDPGGRLVNLHNQGRWKHRDGYVGSESIS